MLKHSFALWVILLAAPALALEGQYSIDTENSRIHVLTDKSGLFGAMGHHHVVTIDRLAGELRVSEGNVGQVTLVLKPEDFLLDDAADIARYPAQFKNPVKEKTIQATRNNMLGKKLFDVANFPEIRVHIQVPDVLAAEVMFDMTLNVKGQTIALRVPGKLAVSDGQLRATTAFTSSNPTLGLPVFKALGGAMAVGKKLAFEVDVLAVKR